MGVSLDTKQAYAEIDEFLGLLNDKRRNEIPEDLRRFFKEEKDDNYKKGINPKIPVKDQNFKEETLAIIALLNLQYWCKDESEKERLMNIYSNNQKVYQEIAQVSFDSDDFFNKRNDVEETIEEKSMVEYKEPMIKKIVNYILKFFHLK